MFIGLSAFNITGFNRTFMELKFSQLGGSNESLQFQSYLYGIEIIDICVCVGSVKRVSIVPLWN